MPFCEFTTESKSGWTWGSVVFDRSELAESINARRIVAAVIDTMGSPTGDENLLDILDGIVKMDENSDITVLRLY